MVKLIFLFSLFVFKALSSDSEPVIEHRMDWLNFTFESYTQYTQWMDAGYYKNCMPSGIKFDSDGRLYVSVPRWKEGVYSTLNILENSHNNIGLLRPFPSIEENQINNINALQSVLGFEIDLDDNIWALDQGKINNVDIIGSAKLKKYSKSGKVLDVFELNDYINIPTSFLNDIVLDIPGHHVYITDSGVPNSAIIVINTETRVIRRLLQNDESTNPDPSLWITVNNERVYQGGPTQVGVDGVALSCSKDVLYYTPLTSRILYAINTEYLKNPPKNISKEVIKLGYKYSSSGGLVASRNGRLYLSALELNSILLQTDIKPNAENFQFNLFKQIINDTKLTWPDSLSFNNQKKKLYVMANQLSSFMSGKMNFTHPVNGDSNFYIWSIYANDKSYLEDCLDDDVESDDNSFPTWAIVLVVIVVLVVIAIIVCAIRSYLQAKKKRQTFL